MASYGKIEPFDRETDSWELYVERLNFYFEANKIGDEGDDLKRRRAILLSSVGKKTYKLICDLLAPEKPSTPSYNELCTLVKDHFEPKPSESVQRHKFHNRFRQAGETISEFVAALRHLAEHCNFEATLETMLRDRLVSGVNHEKIQRRLLSEAQLTFKKAYEISSAMEAAAQHMQDLQMKTGNPSPAQVNYVRPAYSKQSRGSGESKPSSSPADECHRCGKLHNPEHCRFKTAKCHYCKKVGHIKSMCRKKAQKKPQGKPQTSSNTKNNMSTPRVHALEVKGEETDDDLYPMFAIHDGSRKNPFMVDMTLNGLSVKMELDTGASHSVISEDIYHQLRDTVSEPLELEKSTVQLQSYTGNCVPVLGQLFVRVQYKDVSKDLPVVVVQGNSPSLLGRDWLQHIKLAWNEIFHLSASDQEFTTLLHKHATVFEEGLGTVRGVKAKIYVDPEAKPKYFKPRPVAYALRAKVDEELDRLLKEGTIRPVEFSEWATPIVPIVKSDGTIRICGDFKVTLNQVSKLDNYPIPKTEDLLTQLGGGVHFTKLDLSQAYQQLELEEESKRYTTISTHKGLFEYNRLCYGIASAPGIFQRTMENLLQGIPNVVVRIDDILIGGKTPQDHLRSCSEVLSRLDEAGIRLRKDKCIFGAPEVTYLGHRINQQGIQPVQQKVEAIQDSPRPTNLKELQAFLGMLNYYSCYIPNVTDILAPLHELLQKHVPWRWTQEQEDAWNKAKSALESSQLLVHYSLEKEVTLACNASPFGLGCVSHIMEDGSGRPISYVSRTLTAAERNYSQLDKEAAALIFGIRKFHPYLYGRQFKAYTDHKPLLGLFKSDKPVPQMASPRIQRWALFLSGYSVELVYREGSRNGNADGLSRLVPGEETPVPIPSDLMLLM